MKDTKINLGPIDSISLGQGRVFLVNNHDVAVFRSRDGRLFAVQNQCPHRGGPLSEGIIGEGKVVCPLHGHKFDLGNGQGSEPHECVKVYKVFSENNHIFLSGV